MKLYQPAIVRKEVDDTHYYYVDEKFTPSVTKIIHEAMPMAFELRKWREEMGTDRANAALERAGDRGTLIHNTCESLMRGDTVELHKLFPNRADQKVIVGFVNWFNDYKPTFKDEDIELTVASTKGYAGTLDLFCHIQDTPVIVDFKSSAGVYDSHKLQITSYQHAYYEMTGVLAKRMILHLSSKTKAGYSVYGEDKMTIAKKPVTMDDFDTVFNMYKMLNGGTIPEPDLVETYPSTLKLFEEAK